MPSTIGTSPNRSPGCADADDALDAVLELDRLDLSVEQPEERLTGALLRGVLPRLEPDVGRSARQALPVLGAESAEHGHSRNLLRGDHPAEPIDRLSGRARRSGSGCPGPR